MATRILFSMRRAHNLIEKPKERSRNMTPFMVAIATVVLSLLAMFLGLITDRETQKILQKANVNERPKKALHVVMGILVFLSAGYDMLLLSAHP
jgi:hypothetical protein